MHHIFKDGIARKAHTHTRKETGERAAFRDWGFGAVAIGAALQDGPLACVGQVNGPLSVSGRFAGCICDSRPVYSRYLLKSAVYGDSYLRKSAEFS